jgi:hypothetical protein
MLEKIADSNTLPPSDSKEQVADRLAVASALPHRPL